MSEFKFPTEEVELPSKGLVYPEDNPLSNGKIEIKYMTAKEEDILTNQAYIQKGIVLDKLIDSLIVNKDINYKDLILGDKNAVLIAARILGYGKDYKFEWKGEEQTVDLTEIDNKKFCAISSIESILWPNLCPEYATLPEIVRNQVEKKYGNELKKFVIEEK